MNKNTFENIEKYMLTCMTDGAHNEQHIYRVLYAALDIASDYSFNKDVLIAASLLHDIGRDAQIKNPKLDHATVGSEMAYKYLLDLGWNEPDALHAKSCIYTHRFRNSNEPESIEAKILFDADKLDVTGTIGIARTLAYQGVLSIPLYTTDQNGNVLDGSTESEPSFFHEYHLKLKYVYDKFYTAKAKQIAKKRQQASIDFYERMFEEVKMVHVNGMRLVKDSIDL